MFEIRRAVPGDATALAHVDACIVAAGVGVVQDVPRGAAGWVEAINDALVWVGLHEGVSVGFLELSRFEPQRLAHNATLGMGVTPDHQARGLGSALIKRALTEAHALSIQRIELCVRSDNTRAIELYRRCGFQLVGTRSAFVRTSTGDIGDHLFERVL